MSMDIAERILRKDPENHGILRMLGQIYLKEEDYENALTCFLKALQTNAHHPSVHEKLGEIRYRQGRYKQALGSFSRALELDPNRRQSPYCRQIEGR